MDLIGLGDDPRSAGFVGRIEHRDEVDQVLSGSARRGRRHVRSLPRRSRSVHDMEGLAADPHMIARGTVVDLDGTPM